MHQDIVRLLQPTVVALRVCGVCPSALRKLHIPNSNRAYSIVQATIVVFVISSIVYRLHWILNDITYFFGVMKYVLLVCSLLVMIVSAFLTSGGLVRFFKILESVQKSLFYLNIRQPAYPSASIQLCWVAFLFLPIMCMTVSQIYAETPCDLILIKIIISMVRTGTVCKLRVLMSVLNHKLELLNWHLKDLNHFWPSFLPRPQSHDAGFHHLSQGGDRRSKKFVHKGLDTGTLTTKKVKSFNKAHLKVHYAYRSLNSIFSLPLFAMYVSAGFNISFHVFMIKSKEIHYDKYATGLGIMEEVVSILLTSSLSSIIEKNFKTTAHLVNNLLDDESNSEEVVKELEKFSMILLHRKTTFSAAGFFDTNLKIVTRMASLFAPIILFLVQNNNRPRAGRGGHQ